MSNEIISFAFGISADEAANWKKNLELVSRLPQPASGSKRNVEIRGGIVSVAYKDKNDKLVFSYRGVNDHLAGWIVAYEGKAEDFGYGDTGLLDMPHRKMEQLRRAISRA